MERYSAYTSGKARSNSSRPTPPALRLRQGEKLAELDQAFC